VSVENKQNENSEIHFFDGKPRRIIIHAISPIQADVRILGRSFTDAECRVTRLADYDLIDPPANGSVCYREMLVFKSTG